MHCIAACGPAYRRRLATAETVVALCASASADLLGAVGGGVKTPLTDGDLPQLRHAAAAVAFLVGAAVADGASASTNLLDSGVVELLVQVRARATSAC